MKQERLTILDLSELSFEPLDLRSLVSGTDLRWRRSTDFGGSDERRKSLDFSKDAGGCGVEKRIRD